MNDKPKYQLSPNQEFTGEDCPKCGSALVTNVKTDWIGCPACHYIKQQGWFGEFCLRAMHGKGGKP